MTILQDFVGPSFYLLLKSRYGVAGQIAATVAWQIATTAPDPAPNGGLYEL